MLYFGRRHAGLLTDVVFELPCPTTHNGGFLMKISKVAAHITGLFGAMPVARCAAMVGTAAMLAFAPAAHAIVVMSPASNIVVPATTAGVYINVVSGVSNVAPALAPGWDINPFGSTSLIFFNPTAPAGGVYVVTGGTTPVNLALGSVIGPAAAYGSGTANFSGTWQLNATNYFGFRFIGDDTQLHYGYGTMIVGATADVRSVGRLFYESVANTAITVSAVPEPASWALMLGGLAVAGALARRRSPTAA